MTDILNVIKERRSIRKYEQRDVPEEDLQKVLESIQWSPSWANTQCWEVIVVKDQANKAKLQEAMPTTNPAWTALGAAPVVLVLCGKLNNSGYYKGKVSTKFGDWFMFDLGIATQSLCLAAHSLGLGTVVAGLFDHDKAKNALGVPDDCELVAIIPMGYPAKGSPAPKRKEIGEFTHQETF